MTYDAFTKVVAQADARGEFLNSGQLDALSAVVADSFKRLDAVNRITSSASKLVTNAARDLFEQQPALIAPGGNAYTHRRIAACLRDLDIILRYVTYATYLGDASVLEDRCLNALRETYLALDVPGGSVAEGVRKIKEGALALVLDKTGITPGDCSGLAAEIGTYFDRAAAAVGLVPTGLVCLAPHSSSLASFIPQHPTLHSHVQDPSHRSGCRRRFPGPLPSNASDHLPAKLLW